MSHSTVMSRGRALASLGAVLGLGLSMAAVTGGTATSAEPAGDCKAAYPVASLTDGDAVTGLTVSKGTTPEGFTGEVLGVLDDGIGPDLDMVLVRLDSPAIQQAGGIWSGMSGSPVYAADGRLIGAVAYGLAYGPSPVAGVTPFEDMDNYLASARPGTIKVGGAVARTIAGHSDVTRAQAEEGLSQLKMPLGVSGIGARRLEQAQATGKHAWLPKETYAMGSSAAPGVGAGPDTIVAGGNLAASLSYGDVTQAGVGTATSVCNGKVVGFGHPMAFLGATTLTMHPADAIYIQEESLGAPFKVANLGAPAGTITDDHLTGITGLFGTLPETADITSAVSYRDRSRTGASHVSVPSGAAATTFYELVANHDRVLDAIVPGSELLSWTITGHEGDGSPFTISVTDRYASDYDITFDSAYELADFVYSLSAVRGVTIDDVTMDSDVIDDNSTWEVSRVEQYVGGAWTKAGKGAPIVTEAGKTLRLRAVLTGATGTRTVPVSLKVPEKASGSMGRLFVVGGSYTWSRLSYPNSVAQAEKYADTLVRNDQIQVSLDVAKRRSSLTASKVTQPLDKVVVGGKRVRVIVQ
ncbi:MAG: hypothetical protein JWO76_765 [Nocardioides sp.]|nr:hypothetical protein [Nocardioides sp.]